MLAVLLDRHSRIAIPPETQFYTEFLPRMRAGGEVVTSREQKVQRALAFPRIADLRLDAGEVLARFTDYENSYANLLRAILETYGARAGKDLVGEKSPKHILHVAELLRDFPGARVICIVRDGRDVARSLLKVPWAEPGNRRRLGIFCMEWCDSVRLALGYRSQLPGDSFWLVKYENLLANPEQELAAICVFLGLEFEREQLLLTGNSGVVPSWEAGWKVNASQSLNAGRIEAWRQEAEPAQIWEMNSMMGTMLRRIGYRDTGLGGCPLTIRLKYLAKKIPYLRPLRPISLLGLKMLRWFFPAV